MSIKQYPGGIVTKNPTAPAGPYEDGAAPGIWTLGQVADYVKQGIWPTAGEVNPSAFIENLFSTYLYTGNGATQTITNGIDLAGEGGLVWAKPRSVVGNNTLYDTARGVSKALISNSAVPEQDYSGNGVTSFNSNGFAVTDSGPYAINDTGTTYVSWAFREQPKFFDIVTYTGNQAVGHNIPHNLGSTPGLIIVKAYDGDNRNWFIYHRSLGATKHLVFTTAAETVQTDIWNDTEPTSTQFTVGDSSNVNQSGRPYIAYLFAHDAGGFGLSGEDNVISCGSYTGNGTSVGPVVDLGYEPQWIMVKHAAGADNWYIINNMTGMVVGGADNYLFANTNNAELTGAVALNPLATGFQPIGGNINSNGTYIYIAIRRGPMKVPESGTSVFAIDNRGGTTPALQSTFPVDGVILADVSGGWVNSPAWGSRLTGTGRLASSNANAEATDGFLAFDYMNGWGNDAGSNPTNWSYMFRRAPGFFDEVCYTGTGSAMTLNHNLGVVPEMMIVKSRSAGSTRWCVYHTVIGNNLIFLDADRAVETGDAAWNNQVPTSSVFYIGTYASVNAAARTFVNYLFATCPGVSKVGSYTGTGTTQIIDCGFTAGARFVLIKRISGTNPAGDWYVWDSARGIVAGNDPYLLLNSTAAEVTSTDYIDTYSAGFEITSTAPAAINASGGSFIFLAIA